MLAKIPRVDDGDRFLWCNSGQGGTEQPAADVQ